MFKLTTTLLLAIAVTGPVLAVPIDDIQQYDPDGTPNSPHDGQIVSVQGTLYVNWGIFDSGTHYIVDDTGGIAFYLPSSGLAIGDLVEVTGIVGQFSGEIELVAPTANYLGSAGEPTPHGATTGELAGDYERVGDFVQVVGNVVSKSYSEFELATSGEDPLLVYIDSSTGIDIDDVAVGAEFEVTGALTTYYGQIELLPRFQSDLVEDPSTDPIPVIVEVLADDHVPMPTDPVNITAVIQDNNLVEALLYYRDSDGEDPGDWVAVPMTSLGSDNYGATIPAGHVGSQIDYYVEASDDGSQSASLPASAPDEFYELAVGITPIYAMQYVHPDSSDVSPYRGKVLNIRGVVTAGTADTGHPAYFVVQEQEVGPYDGYAYGGVVVYEATASTVVQRGDVVEIGGYCEEYFGLTEMVPHHADAVEVISFGAPLPAPAIVATGILGDDVVEDGDGRLGEAWEGVWVRSAPSWVVGTDFYGVITISDSGALADSVQVDPTIELADPPAVDDRITAEGYLTYHFGNFQIRPIADEFVQIQQVTSADDLPPLSGAGGFTSVAPNPFNPAVQLDFVLNREVLAQLAVYDLRGELVASLVDERLPSGHHHRTWDGRDRRGLAVASGIYVARLRLGAEVLQVRKLTLLE